MEGRARARTALLRTAMELAAVSSLAHPNLLQVRVYPLHPVFGIRYRCCKHSAITVNSFRMYVWPRGAHRTTAWAEPVDGARHCVAVLSAVAFELHLFTETHTPGWIVNPGSI